MVTSLICGCKHDQRSWIGECEPHRAEHAGIHLEAAQRYCQRRDTDKFEPMNHENEDLR